MNKAELTIIHRNGSKEIIFLKAKETIFGRENCAVKIDDVKASRKHALITQEGPIFKIKDLSSSNGTFINGARIAETALCDVYNITIGNTTLYSP